MQSSPTAFFRGCNGVEVGLVQDNSKADGLGGEVWAGAYLLSSFLNTEDRAEELLRGRRVLDLGTGTGFVGLSAAALGASRVLLTDEFPDLASQNVQVNRATLRRSRVAAKRLIWGEKASPATLEGIQVVLGAEVTYNRKAQGALVATLAALLPALPFEDQRRAVFFLDCDAQGNLCPSSAAFQALAADAGFDIVERHTYTLRDVPAIREARDATGELKFAYLEEEDKGVVAVLARKPSRVAGGLLGTEERVRGYENLRREGNALLNEHRHAEALEKYLEASYMVDDPMHALNNAAEALLRMGEYHDSMEFASRVLESDPENPKALHRRGKACLRHQQRLLTDGAYIRSYWAEHGVTTLDELIPSLSSALHDLQRVSAGAKSKSRAARNEAEALLQKSIEGATSRDKLIRDWQQTEDTTSLQRGVQVAAEDLSAMVALFSASPRRFDPNADVKVVKSADHTLLAALGFDASDTSEEAVSRYLCDQLVEACTVVPDVFRPLHEEEKQGDADSSAAATDAIWERATSAARVAVCFCRLPALALSLSLLSLILLASQIPGAADNHELASDACALSSMAFSICERQFALKLCFKMLQVLGTPGELHNLWQDFPKENATSSDLAAGLGADESPWPEAIKRQVKGWTASTMALCHLRHDLDACVREPKGWSLTTSLEKVDRILPFLTAALDAICEDPHKGKSYPTIRERIQLFLGLGLLESLRERTGREELAKLPDTSEKNLQGVLTGARAIVLVRLSRGSGGVEALKPGRPSDPLGLSLGRLRESIDPAVWLHVALFAGLGDELR